MKKKRVVIGMSGGVDSSIAAHMLQKQGYEVLALFMINWKDSSVTLSGDCSWEEDSMVAEMVCRKMGIPLEVVDSSEDYRKRVVDYMFSEYEKGRTPNPDVLCNREIKFDVFRKYASEIDADFIATGHYGRMEQDAATEEYCLLRGLDRNKDQSYFLCQLDQQQLSNVIFPIGHLLKPEVRKIAAELDLPTAERKDSQGICFVGKVDLPTFLQQQLKPKQGDIIEIPADHPMYGVKNLDDSLAAMAKPYAYQSSLGTVVGNHRGAHYFTIGQRKGLNVGGKAEPLFVLATDTKKNIIYTGQGQDHPGLYRKGLFIRKDEIHWVRPGRAMNTGESRKVEARIRYRQPLQNATLFQEKEGMYVIFDELQRGVTAGQFAAWYEGEELTGSGIIDQ